MLESLHALFYLDVLYTCSLAFIVVYALVSMIAAARPQAPFGIQISEMFAATTEARRLYLIANT